MKEIPGKYIPRLRLVSQSMKTIADDPMVRAKFYLEVPSGTAPEDIQKKVMQQDSLVTVTMSESDLTVAVLEKLVEHNTLSKLYVRPGGPGLHLDMSNLSMPSSTP